MGWLLRILLFMLLITVVLRSAYRFLYGVIEGAGGVMTDWQGQPMTLKSGDRVLAAGDPRLHEQVLKILNG